MLEQRTQGWTVVDLHKPMSDSLVQHRQQDPSFAFSKDGIHPQDYGQWLMARAILAELGGVDVEKVESAEEMLSGQKDGSRILKLIENREQVMRNAWLTETHYLQPDIKPGLPLSDAQKKADALGAQIQLLAKS